MDGDDMADILVKKSSSSVILKKLGTYMAVKKSIEEISVALATQEAIAVSIVPIEQISVSLETTENISVVLTPVEEITV